MPRIKTVDEIPDIQNTTEGFPKLRIPKVGSRLIKVPLEFVRKDGTVNPSKGVISIYTDLSPQNKGTNMSRYRIMVEELIANKTHQIDQLLDLLLDECVVRLGSRDAYIKIKFDFFLLKEAPVSKIKSHMDYEGWLEGKLINREKKFYMHATVLYASLCPCSKEISDYGAHNQQSYADVTVQLSSLKKENRFWFEDLIDIVERSASAPMINALKRVDEAYQTELMYENPVFVEDVVRRIASKLNDELDKKILDYNIVVNHYESIHSSAAVAILNAGRELK